MSELITLARPYAKAAYEHAKDTGTVQAWSNELRVAGGMAQSDDVQALFHRPDVATDALVNLVAGDGGDAHYRNFIRLLADNDRLPLLAEIAGLFEFFKEQDTQQQTVDVYSAVSLSDDHQKRMIAALEKRTGKKISLRTHLDESLLGGARIHCGDLVIDGTLKGKVERLKSELFN